jgi:APA family basic amino acid/polyamine antiporter
VSGHARTLGPLTATMLVVASMVGTGVFTTTGFLVADIGSNPAVLACWALGGGLALAGALCYGELAAAMPHNGGEYLLLSRIYHPALGFVAGWISLIVGFSAPIAAAALAFSRYLAAVFPGIPELPISLGLIALLSGLHCLRLELGSGFQNAFTIGKTALILAFIVGGLWLGQPARCLEPGAVAFPEALMSSGFAVGLVYISFSYQGWNAALYIAGELKQPERWLPLSLVLGTAVVTVLYLGLNAVFLAATPAPEIAGQLEVGHIAASALFGPGAARLLSTVIAVGLVSTVGAYIMTGPRVYEAMGQRSPGLRFVTGRVRGGGPVRSILLQGAVAAIMVLTASFDALLTYTGFTLSGVAALAVLGVVVLRVREPGLHRPYRTWGYPLTPVAFVALMLWMMGHSVIERPVVALAGAGTVAVGFLLWWLLEGRAGSSGEHTSQAQA